MAADPGLPNHPGQLAKSVGAELDAILPPPSRPTGPRSPHVHILAAGRRVAGPHWRGLGSFAAALLVGLSIGSLTAHDRPPAAPAQPAPPPAVVASATPAPAPIVPVQAAPVIQASPVPQAASRPESPRRAETPRGARGYGAVLAADRRLRDAYDRAARAGVDRPTLVSYRARWASLRRRASDEPPRLIHGYGALASDLEMLARDRRAARRRA